MENKEENCGHNLWNFSPDTCSGCKKKKEGFEAKMKEVDMEILKDPKFLKTLKEKIDSPEYQAEIAQKIRPYRTMKLLNELEDTVKKVTSERK